MTDRELLELAAEAAGLDLRLNKRHPWGEVLERRVVPEPDEPFSKWLTWDPITDDGDALRLAVKLRLTVKIADHEIEVFDQIGDCLISVGMIAGEDYDAAARRAITRAAAEIGRAL